MYEHGIRAFRTRTLTIIRETSVARLSFYEFRAVLVVLVGLKVMLSLNLAAIGSIGAGKVLFRRFALSLNSNRNLGSDLPDGT